MTNVNVHPSSICRLCCQRQSSKRRRVCCQRQTNFPESSKRRRVCSDTFWPLRMFVKIFWVSQAQIGTHCIRSAKHITKSWWFCAVVEFSCSLAFLALCSSKYSATSQNQQVKMVWGWFMGYKHSSCSLTYGLLVHRYACTDLQKVHLGTHSKGYACRNTQTCTCTHWHSYMYIYNTKADLQGENPNLAAPESKALSLMNKI